MGAVQQMGVDAERDVGEQRANPLIEGWRAAAVQHRGSLGSEPVGDPPPQRQVVDQGSTALGRWSGSFTLDGAVASAVRVPRAGRLLP
jgi:hypothetical protein